MPNADGAQAVGTVGSLAPTLAFSTFLTGASPFDVSVGPDGAVYLTGAAAAGFKTQNAFQSMVRGPLDAFVMKIDVARGRVVYASFLGGEGEDRGVAIAVDAAGNAYLGGYTDSFEFPVRNAFQPHIGVDAGGSAGGGDGFVAKIDPSGALVSSTYFGGDQNDSIKDLTVDANGSVCVAGHTWSPDLPTVRALQPTFDGGPNSPSAFVAEFTPAGDDLVFSTYLGGAASTDVARGVAIATDESIAVVGYTYSADFPVVGPAQANIGGGADAFVTRLAPAGTAVVFSTFLGGSEDDIAASVAFDPGGAVYVCGVTRSPNLPTTADALEGEYQGGVSPGPSSPDDGFLAKVASNGASFEYASYLGGSGEDYAFDTGVDERGNVYVTGCTASTEYPVTPNALQSVYGGDDSSSGFPQGDVFVTCLSSADFEPLYSTFLGGAGTEIGYGVAVRPNGTAIIVGFTESKTFPLVRPLADRFRRNFSVGYVAELTAPFPSIASAVFDSSAAALTIVASGSLNGDVAVDVDGVRVSPPRRAAVNTRKGRVRVKGTAAELHVDGAGEHSVLLVVDGVVSDPHAVELR
ncbi:MAG TPA: hypothetical protein PLF26_16190 [Blastocatellia bacterium]|nr:hypothetical protein [Blastocatellia bacterium]